MTSPARVQGTRRPRILTGLSTVVLALFLAAGIGATAAVAVPAPTGVLEGTVTGGGSALSGISVSVLAGGSFHNASTDVNGHFRLIDVPVGTQNVSFSDNTSAWLSTTVPVSVTDGATTTLPAVSLLPLDKTLGGIVRDAVTSQPVAGIRVSVSAPGISASADTDAQGRYVLDHLGGATVTVSTMSTSAYQSTSHTNVAIPDTAFDMTVAPLPTGDGVVSGTITDRSTGSPIANASVAFWPGVQNGGSRTTQTDAHGSYAFTNLPRGSASLSIYAYGYTQPPSASISVGATPLIRDIRLAPIEIGTGSITATFVDDAGAPIVGMYVGVGRVGGMNVPGSWPTDSSGTVTVPGLTAGTYAISPTIPQSGNRPVFASLNAAPVTVATSTTAVTGLRYTLTRFPTGTGSVHGILTDARTNTPISGAQITVASRTTGASFSATTGSGGGWTVTNLADGSYAVSVQFASFWAYEAAAQYPTLVIAGAAQVERTDSVRSLAPGTSVLSGTVRDFATHQPVAGAQISLTRNNGGAEPRYATTDANGVYTFSGLSAGQYIPLITAPGYNDSNNTTGIEVDGTAAQRVNFALRPSPPIPAGSGTITVTVRTSDGDPISGASVYIAPVAGTGATLGGSDKRTDDSGRVEWTGLPLTTVSVTVVALTDNTLAPYDGTVTLSGSHTSESLAVTLYPGAAISGTVSAGALGSLPANLTVREVDPVTGASSGQGGAVDPTTGAFTITHLAPGAHLIQLMPAAAADSPSIPPVYWVARTPEGVVLASAATPITLAAGEVSGGHDLALAHGGAITGTVRMSTDQGPVALADGKLIRIEAYAQSAGVWTQLDSAVASVAGGGNGDFRVSNLAAGDYRLRFVDQYAGSRALTTTYNGGGTSFDAAPVIHIDASGTFALPTVSMAPLAPAADPAPVNLDRLSGPDLAGLEGAITTDSTATAGQDVTITVGSQYAGEYVAVWANSTPRQLSGWTRVAPNGTVSAAIPTDLPGGAHRIVVQDASQQPLGWAPITVTAAPAGSGQGSGPSSNPGAAASGSDATGGSGSAGSGSASTGSAATGSGTATSTGGTSSTSKGSGASSSSSTDATPAATPSPATTAAPSAAPSSTTPPAPSAVAPTATTPTGGTGPSPLVVALIVIGALVVLAVAGVIVFRRRAA